MTANTFTEAALTFIETAFWLTDEHEPSVTGLLRCAQELDSEFRAATFAQYTLTHRWLMKQRPLETGAEDEDPDLHELA